jgi:hypothetical protein
MHSRVWIGSSLSIALVATVLFARSDHAPYLTNDAYQYVDVARNFNAGECICTHVAHFDEQVAPARMPVEFTHFPPGYPLLMALLARIGFSFEMAGLGISAAGYLITLWLMWDIGLTLGAKPWALAILSLLWVGNSHALLDAVRVGTEGLFTAAVVAMGAVMVRDIRGGGRSDLLPLVGLIAGAAYWIRYAGLFLIPVAALFLLWRWQRTPEAKWKALAGLVAEAALTITLMARNVEYTGSWRGGFGQEVHRSIRLALVETIKAYYHLVFGDRVIVRLDIWAVVFCLSLAATLLFILQAWRRREWVATPKFVSAALVWIGVIIVAYVGGVTLAFLTTIAGDLTRYTRPVYPLVLALASLVISAALRGRQVLAVIALVGSILVVHSRSLLAPPPVAQEKPTREALNLDVQPNVTAGVWLLSHVSSGGVIVAVGGQAVEYLLHRDVVSVIEPEFTNRRLDAAGFRALMGRFHARYLLLFPGLAPEYVPEQEKIPFLHDLASGRSLPPEWLVPAARNSAIAIYECGICAGADLNSSAR